MRIGITKLRALSTIAVRQGDPVRRWQAGMADMDYAIGGGFAFGRVHEVFAASGEDAPAGAGFALALATGAAGKSKAVIWLRSARASRAGGVIQGAGLAELGGAPETCLFALVEDGKTLLRATVDALRCGGLGAVVAEGWGRMPELDLTASRRLSLAAEQSGVPLLLLRVDAEPVPSAAETRWRVSAAPSCALPGNAPGGPCFNLELMRCRSRPAGQSWQLEWDRDRKLFRDASVPGVVVPVPLRKQAADRDAGPLRQAA
jgi:protein ImuA